MSFVLQSVREGNLLPTAFGRELSHVISFNFSRQWIPRNKESTLLVRKSDGSEFAMGFHSCLQLFIFRAHVPHRNVLVDSYINQWLFFQAMGLWWFRGTQQNEDRNCTVFARTEHSIWCLHLKMSGIWFKQRVKRLLKLFFILSLRKTRIHSFK